MSYDASLHREVVRFPLVGTASDAQGSSASVDDQLGWLIDRSPNGTYREYTCHSLWFYQALNVARISRMDGLLCV